MPVGSLAAVRLVMVVYPVDPRCPAQRLEGRRRQRTDARMARGGLFNRAAAARPLSIPSSTRSGRRSWRWCWGSGSSFLSTRPTCPAAGSSAALALMPILVPPFILVVGWVALADPNAGVDQYRRLGARRPANVAVNINTMPGIIWITGLFLTPYVYLLVAAGFANSDPAVEEAARVSGAGPAASALHGRPAAAAAGTARGAAAGGDHERRRLHHPVHVGLKARIYLLPSLIWQNTSSFPARPGLAAAQALLLVAGGAALHLSCSGAPSRAAPATPCSAARARQRPRSPSAGGAIRWPHLALPLRARLVGVPVARGRRDGVHEVLGALCLRRRRTSR